MIQEVCQSFINGNFIKTTSSALTPNLFPGTNKIINQIAYATDKDIAYAADSSAEAFHVWSKTPLNQRSQRLLNAATLLRHKVKEIASVEVWDTGKPIREALSVDVHSAADCLEYFAKIALAYESQVIPDHNALIYTTHEPLGVCAAIGAWNYPLQIACWKAAPALIMGNTMVYKPSELTPMTTLMLAEVMIEAGIPPGVFNVVLGDGQIATKLIDQPHVAKISFTGSVATGKKVQQQAAQHLIPTTLELGGKSPLIVFDDANIEQAIFGSMLANFYTQGEICSNGTRVFVSKKIFPEFIEKLLQQVKRLVIGDPFDHRTQIGALISQHHLNRVLHYISMGKEQGAELIYGGKQVLNEGNFIEPTIFIHCNDEMTIVNEEIFGPVMSILQFEDEAKVIARANQTKFGLAAGIFTENIKRAHRVAKQLQSGVCWINNYNVTPVAMPFGGYKQSGMGRENGILTLSHYSKVKSIYVELNEVQHDYH